MKSLLILISFMIGLDSQAVFANSGDMMRGGGHMGGFMWLVGILYLAGVILFLWFLFRIVRALERIAQAKEESKFNKENYDV